MKKVLLSAAASFWLAATVHADPFAKADPGTGKKLYDEAKCSACHDSLMGGDGNRVYTRPDHKIRNFQALLKQVRFCVDRTGAAVFPEDIEHIAAYLNQRFYKFKQ